MKLLIITALFATGLAACAVRKQHGQNQADFAALGKDGQLQDSFLHVLQQQNDTLLIASTESRSWGGASYDILARRNGEWRAYTYSYENMLAKLRIEGFAPQIFKQGNVSQEECNSTIFFLGENNVWKIKGSNETSCEEKIKNGYYKSGISDARTWCLYFVTPAIALKIEYYAPQYFEEHCPGDIDRKLFISAINRVKQVFSKSDRR